MRRRSGQAALLVLFGLLAACARPAARPPRVPGAPSEPFAAAPRDGRMRRLPADRMADEVPIALAPRQRAAVAAHAHGAPRLSWPTDRGVVTSPYGRRGRRHHDGIDISVPYGTPVFAAADGEVVYAGSLRGYGRMLIIRHRRGFVTVYAHNARHEVVAGARVRRGERIARVGRSGRTTGVNLHFEVRQDNVAYDPLGFLPPRERVVAREE